MLRNSSPSASWIRSPKWWCNLPCPGVPTTPSAYPTTGDLSPARAPWALPRWYVTRPVLFISFLDYWQVTLIWSPYGDASLIRSLLIGDTSTTYYTDVVARVTMTLYQYWSHSFIFLPAFGPIWLVDSCAARCCDSELRLTVHCCALWPIIAVTLLFLWRLLFALLYCSLTVYKSGLLGTL